MHQRSSLHLWCKRVTDLMKILPQIHSSSPQLMPMLLLHPTIRNLSLRPPGKALLAQKCWALLQTQPPHCPAVCAHLSCLSASWPPHRAANGKKIPPNFLPQHLLMVEESSPLIIPHQQCPASPAASSGSAATQTRGTWVSHLWPHKATINTTLVAAAGMCARRKHHHHNFYDIFWSLREDHCMSLKQL